MNPGLPLGGLVDVLRKFGDISAGVLERDKLAAARQGNWIVEWTFPVCLSLAGQRRIPSA
jgi:hypothetical protein